MPYIYISSGYFGYLVLEALNPKPSLVITQPGRLGGRGMKTLIPTYVKKTAQNLQLPFIEVSSKKQLHEEVEKHRDKIILLSDFGMIIPEVTLSIARYGIWNIHPSLLPQYRGATPIQSAILNNEKQTGVSVIKMDEQVDHGSILSQASCEIGNNDTTLTLMSKLAKLGAELFTKLLSNPQLALQNATLQEHQKATFTKKLTKTDGYIPFEKCASYLTPIFKKYNLLHLLPESGSTQPQMDVVLLHNKIRALMPWPGVWSKTFKEAVVKLKQSAFEDQTLRITKISIDNRVYTQ